MKFHELEVSAKKSKKRVGRGISAGGGKTAGRGTKGQSSRSGGSVRPGFEGGQNPIIARLPKLRGFKSHRTQMQQVTTAQIDSVKDKVVTSATLKELGMIKSVYAPVKVVTKGEIKTAKTVQLQAVTPTAEAAITKVGGSFEAVPSVMKPKKENAKGKKAKKAKS